jgi:2-methylcitrate synthase
VTAGNTPFAPSAERGTISPIAWLEHPRHRDACEFEEIAYLLVHGKLPTRAELASYKTQLKSLRGLPEPIKEILERIPAAAHPMDVLRTAVSALGSVLPEKEDHGTPGARDSTDRLLASLGSMLLYWYH